MTTRSVRFEFIGENTINKLKFNQNIPSHLITVESPSLRSPAYANSFLNAVTPIIKGHENDCRQASLIMEIVARLRSESCKLQFLSYTIWMNLLFPYLPMPCA